MSNQKIILAYSGGLDTSVAIKWLHEQYHYDVIAVAVDVGEGKNLHTIKQKALTIGAINCHIVDAQNIFATEYLLPALQANALYEGVYPLISALSRPLIAKILVSIAHQEGAVAVAHGCTGKGNDQVRFDVGFATLDPSLKIVAPQREHPMAREDAIAYAEKHGIPLPIKLDNPFSIDQNLWGRSCECGILEDPWVEPPEAAYELTRSINDTPDQAETIEIEFAHGVPLALNGIALPLVELIGQLNTLAGIHGVGRIDHIENRLIGIKSREVYEAPAALTLIKAHQALEALTLTRDVLHFKPFIEQQFAKLVYEGFWHAPLREAICQFIKATQKNVNGTIRLKLHKGHAIVTGRSSKNALYSHELATYKTDDRFDHKAAEGFIKLWGLPLMVNARINAAENHGNPL